MFRFVVSALCFCLLSLAGFSASAQTSLDTRGGVTYNGGSIIPGYDNRTCDGTIEGAIRYNSSTSAVEFCNGNTWAAPGGGGGCTSPPDCPNPGDICSDGSRYIGQFVFNTNCESVFASVGTPSGSYVYSTVYEDNVANDYYDGNANHSWIVDNRTLSQYPAFEVCENLSAHGNSDWYLPATTELLRTVPLLGLFETNSGYWSSTEGNADYGEADTAQYVMTETDGDLFVFADDKQNPWPSGSFPVICHRRE
jgi:hypothetical protein